MNIEQKSSLNNYQRTCISAVIGEATLSIQGYKATSHLVLLKHRKRLVKCAQTSHFMHHTNPPQVSFSLWTFDDVTLDPSFSGPPLSCNNVLTAFTQQCWFLYKFQLMSRSSNSKLHTSFSLSFFFFNKIIIRYGISSTPSQTQIPCRYNKMQMNCTYRVCF